jgi:hypothetical protein
VKAQERHTDVPAARADLKIDKVGATVVLSFDDPHLRPLQLGDALRGGASSAAYGPAAPWERPVRVSRAQLKKRDTDHQDPAPARKADAGFFVRPIVRAGRGHET